MTNTKQETNQNGQHKASENLSTGKLRKAARQKAKIRLLMSGPAGSGKTVSALLTAYGMTNDWNKIAVIDTENNSADLYANHTLPNKKTIGEFQVISIQEPFEPEKYIDAIHECEAAGIEVVIIDSISHEWNGKGGCLEIHEAVTQAMRIPNSFTAWAKVTPRHQKFIETILQSPVHIINTVRSKTEYVLTDKSGKQVPQKVGMAGITRDGFEYEVTVSLDMDIEHKATASKDRTGLFMGFPSFIPSEETGKKIIAWCESGMEAPAPAPDATPKMSNEKVSDTVKQTISKFTDPDKLMEYAKLQTHLHTNANFRKLIKDKETELLKKVVEDLEKKETPMPWMSDEKFYEVLAKINAGNLEIFPTIESQYRIKPAHFNALQEAHNFSVSVS